MSATNTPVAQNETFSLSGAGTDAAKTETNGQPEPAKGAGALLKEVQGETAPKKPAKAKPKKGGNLPPKLSKEEEAEIMEESKKNDPRVTLDFANLPAPTLTILPRKEAFLDRRLQHRSQLQDIREGGAVDQYAQAMKDGAKFPPVEAVLDISDTPDKGTYWVWDGFQRVGAYGLAGIKEIPVNVRPGTFADALMLSLRQNSENSVLPRTKDDARRAVFALLDNEAVLASVFAQSKGEGGFHRAASAACGVSIGTVKNALDDRGVKPSGGKLVKAAKKPAPPADPKPDGALSAGAARQPDPVSPEEQAKADKDAFTKFQERTIDNQVAVAVQSAKRLAAVLASLVTDPKYGKTIRAALAPTPLATGPLGANVADFDTEAKEEGKGFFAYYAMLSNWPAINDVCETFALLGKAASDQAERERAAIQAEADKAKAEAEAAKLKAKQEADAKIAAEKKVKEDAELKLKAEAEQAKAREQAKAMNDKPADKPTPKK